MAPTPRYRPGLAKEPPNLLANDLSLLSLSPRTARFLNKTRPFLLCYYSVLVYWTSPKFLYFYRRDGLVNMWRALEFQIASVIWIIYLAFLAYLLYPVVYSIPKMWRDKSRQIIGGWEKGRTVLVLGSHTCQGTQILAEQLLLSNKAEDTLFICIDRYNLWWFTKPTLRALVRSFIATKFPIANVLVHSVTDKKCETKKDEADVKKENSPEANTLNVKEENTLEAKEEKMNTPDAKEVEAVSEQSPDVTVRYDQLPLDSNSVDTVFSCCILQSEPFEKDFYEGCLSETLRVLKPGGRAIVMTPNSFFSKVSKKAKTYLEQTGVDFTVERKGGYFWYDVMKPMTEKVVV
ncbi:hypothetical protein FRC17_005715 [Serendipita sp. 399]|nr:hypothetical protein FRC17_005715 [Serendipita sp. 399]